MDVETGIREALSRSLVSLRVKVNATAIPLEFPEDLSHGDWASSVALRCAKEAGMSPRSLAEKIVAQLGGIEGVQEIEVAGPGFINFHLAPEVFANTVRSIIGSPDAWGRNTLHKGEKIMVEYTDPNPFKEFHIGHLMSNAIGESIARLLEFSGAEVKRANYQGDVGLHVAKAMYVLLTEEVVKPSAAHIGEAYSRGSRLYDEDSAAKEQIDALNKKIYDKDPEIRARYLEWRKICLEAFGEMYARLGTTFDNGFYFYESETWERGFKLVKDHANVFVKSDGATIFPGEQYGLHTRVFITGKGLPTYEAKELGLAEMKREKGDFHFLISITASEQAEYFKVVSKAIEIVFPDMSGKIIHRSHGMMRFAEGKMSSRKGNVITGESLLDDLTEVARARAAESRAENPLNLSSWIAVAAIKYQILKQASGKDIVFDRDRALSLEGDSGPYLQYTFARASQVLEHAKSQGIDPRGDASRIPESAKDLVRMLYRFPAAAERAARELEPHFVATFLIELAGLFNRWYAQVRIVEGADAPHKVALAGAAAATLKNGLYLLGIPAPEKM